MQETISNPKPLVSVIIPAFNRETLIKLTLDSVKTQTYENWECLIVDDDSTDNTKEIVKEYQKSDSRFILFLRTELPKGAPTCRNIGLQKAKGKYIIFLDSDDILFPYALERRTVFLEQNPQLNFCVANGIRGEYPINSKNKYFLISNYHSKDVLKEFLSITPPWVCLNPTYNRKSLIEKDIQWDPKIKGFQDIDFHCQTIINELNFDYINEKPDCLWTAHNNGNIGNDLGKNGMHHTQKLYLFNKVKNQTKNKSALNALGLNLLHSYLDTNIPKHISAPTLQILKSGSITYSKTSLYLLKLYKNSLKNHISIVPRIISGLMRVSGYGHLIESKSNTHFLTKQYKTISNILRQ